MRGRAVLVVAGLALTLSVVTLLRLTRDKRVTSARAGVDAVRSEPALRAPDRVAGGRTSSSDGAATQLHLAKESAQVAEPEVARARGPWVSGRVLSAEGAALAGLEVQLATYCASGCQGARFVSTTNAAGVFRVAVPEPRPHQGYGPRHPTVLGSCALLSISVPPDLPGHLQFERWLELEGVGAELDLGLLSLKRGGWIQGVARGGVELSEAAGWRVQVMPRGRGLPTFIPCKSVGYAAPDRFGAFEIEGLPEGQAEVLVSYESLGLVEERLVQVVEGATSVLELDYAGGEPHRILVVLPFQVGSDLPGRASLLDPRGYAHTPRPLSGRRLVFDGLEDEPHELTFEPSRGEPLVLRGLRPGRCVPIPLPAAR